MFRAVRSSRRLGVSPSGAPRLWLAALPLCAVLALMAGPIGCSGSAPVASTDDGPEESVPFYRKVVVNSPGRTDDGTPVAYLEETVLRYEREDVGLTRVYDLRFRMIGFFLADGATYRIVDDPSAGASDEEFLGNHDRAISIERITGVAGPFVIHSGL